MLSDYPVTETEARPAPASKHAVIAVHGIRMFGQWKGRLEILVEAPDRQVELYRFE
jgi:hypothetical protein